MKHFLIIDDDQALGRSLQLQLQAQGYEVTTATSGEAGLAALKEASWDALFLDLTLPDISGLSILQEVQKSSPALPVIMISGRQDMEATISAIKFGAFDYIRKPLDMDAILLAIEKLKHQVRINPPEKSKPAPKAPMVSPRELVGDTPEMMEILKQIGLLSRNRVPVLILGESGTGKELVARALHSAGCADQPFIAINCSAVVPTLLESELFGYEKGAFTGADRQKAGKLEAAGEGVVFFDEIGDMPQDLQAKLLRILQENEFERVGGINSIPFRARPVFATHRNLGQMVKEGTFRKDLYYRIAVARMELPPLRRRAGDIPPLARHLLNKISRSQKTGVHGIAPEALKRLQAYGWPGNVRELENVLTRAAAMSFSGMITPEDLLFENEAEEKSSMETPQEIKPLSEVEKAYIARSLTMTGWNISQTAKLLQISPTTLRKKITDYHLSK